MTAALRTLVIDDDFRVADLHRAIVDRHPGFVTLPPARTLREATEAVRTTAPDSSRMVAMICGDANGQGS